MTCRLRSVRECFRASGPRALALLAVGACTLLSGCASRAPLAQTFIEVRSENFVLTSSLSQDETLEFARSLEYFHAGVRSLIGVDADSSLREPAPVMLFDDRSPGRPYAVAHEAAYLIDAVEAPMLVFRGARDFAARATPELRQRYARRLLRDAAGRETPLWYEEGVSRLACTMSETAKGVHVGRILESDRQAVLDWRGKSLQGVLSRFDLSDASAPERARFTAQAWGIAHLLEFGSEANSAGAALRDEHRRLLAAARAGDAGDLLAGVELSAETLTQRVYRHLETGRPRVRMLEARGFDPRRLAPKSLSRAEGRIRLGRLALRLERPELARDAFLRALEKDPDAVAATFGLAEAVARAGDPGRASALLASAERAPDAASESPGAPAPDLALAAADAYRALASTTPDEPERKRAVARARSLYSDLASGPSPSTSAQIGLALLHLDVPGEDPAGALGWLDRARATRAGSLELELLRARAESRMGETRSAAIRARNVVTRAPDALLVAAARALLATLGE